MKIFKKLLPVIVGLSLVILIAVTLVVVNVATSRTPVLKDGDDAYLKLGNLTVTKQQLYDALKKDYSVAELNRIIDNYLYKDEIDKVTDDELVEFIENDIFGEDFTGDKQEQWEEVIESLIITGIVSEADAKANNKYEDTTSAVWAKVKEYYRLELAKKNWAKAELLKRYEEERKEDGKSELFDDEDIEDYFEENYGKTTIGLIIPFTSSAAAEAMMKKYGINVDASKTSSSTNQLAGWVKSTFDNKNNQYPTPNDYYNTNEVTEIFIAMYNEVLAYTNNGQPIITNDLITKTESEAKTLHLVKVALDDLISNYKSTKGDLQLPTEVSIPNSDKKVSISWEIATESDNFVIDTTEDSNGYVTVTRTAVKSTHKVNCTLTYGEASEEVSYTFEVVATSSEDSDKAELVNLNAKLNDDYNFDVMYNYEFDLNNDMANGHAQFVWEANDDSKFGAYLSASSSELKLSEDAADFVNSYTVKSETVAVSDSVNYYCLMIKLSEGEAPNLEDVKEEIIQKMIEEMYSTDSTTDAYLTELYYVRRKESNLKIYDKFIEALYEYDYNTFYSSTLSQTKYDEFKKTKKTKTDVVATIDGLTITPEDLYSVLETKYGATSVKSFIDQYFIINSSFNTYYNPWNSEIYDKDYVKSLIKSDIKSFKQNFELDYFTYSYLAYYGYIPNFPASYGWKDFIHDYFGVTDEKDLLISKNFGGTIYSDVLTDYRDSLYTFDDIKKAMEKAKADAYSVDVMNLIISVDYDLDGTPDTKIVSSNSDDTKEENWTTEQATLAEELAQLIMTRYDEVLATGTISEKLTEVVSIYNNAEYKTFENPTTLEEAFGKYKLAGLQISFEKSTTYDQSSSLVEEFVDAMKAIWKYADENGLVYDDEAAEEDSNYKNPISSAITYNLVNADKNYAFASSYGFHVVAVEKASNSVELPTEDEAKLYEAANNLSDAQSSLETAKENLESASGNESAVTSYKEQIKQLEKDVDKYIKEVKELLTKLGLEGFDEEENTYELDEDIEEKCEAWYSDAKSEVTDAIVEIKFINDIQKALDNNEISLADGFNIDQLKYYLQYLLDSYQETEE